MIQFAPKFLHFHFFYYFPILNRIYYLFSNSHNYVLNYLETTFFHFELQRHLLLNLRTCVLLTM